MATQNVNIGINVSDNGTAKKVVKNFQEIESAASKAQRAAAGISAAPVKSTLAPGGTSGSRRASEPSGSQQMMSGQDYGSARGSAGLTGASARDFANQAQGLGGLVRLYATLAANVFAASAAFTALKNAADTTNLVRGLDTLGAASGKALGTLSKRLVEVTDGAVSMREAMTATAQASSAGMSGKNIERLALVAKNASLALGVAMPDALSRLSRGIVKLEPELLDELGLFTKIGPATERYALEIGKSVNALSDFERRQAFANAVLEEGEKKFGALADAAANPYDKLLASLKNVIQSGLELVNKILVPIVSLLAESPAALGAVLAGIGVVLLKQALPAIGQLRAGLKNSAEDAFNAANAFKQSFGDEFQTILEKRFKIPDLEAGVKKAQLDLAKLKFPGKMPESIISLTDEKGVVNLTNVNERLKDRNKIIATGMKGTKEASEAQIAAAKQEVAYINKAIELYSKKQALEAGREGLQEVADIAPGRWDAETIAIQKYNNLRDKVDRTNAISNAAQNAQIAGVRGSWALLNTEVAEKGITGFAKYSTLAQGGLAAIGTRVMGVVSSLGRVGEVVGLSIAGFMLLDGWLSKNAKQAEKLNQGLTTAEESIANVARTISAATTIEGFATATIDNTVAFSNALNELSSSLADIIKLSREADKTAGLWDNFWDSIFSVVNKDRASKLSKTIATQIQSSISLLSREGLDEEYKAQLKAILQVDDLDDFDKVSKAWKNLSKAQQDAVVAIQNNANRALGNASSALQSFKDKTDEALKAQKTLSNSFLDSSPAFKYGEGLVAVSTSLSTLISQGPERVAQALQEISANMEKAAMFGSEFVDEFGKISAEFGRQKSVIDGLNAALIDYKKQLNIANSEVKKVDTRTARGQSTETLNVRGSMFRSDQPEVRTNQRGAAFSAANAEKTSAAMISSDYVREVQKALNAAPRDAVDKSLKLVEAAAKSLFDRGMAFIGKAVRDAQTTASITIGKVLTSNLTGPQKLQADAAYAQQEIKARLADIKISEEMLNTQSQLVNEMKLANALQAEANILQKNMGKPDAGAIEKASKEVQKARLGVSGVGAEGMLNSDLLTDQEKASIKKGIADQKAVQQAALRPAKILAESQLDASQLSLKGDLPLAQAQQEEELKKITDRTNASLLARQDIMSSISSVTSAEIIRSKQNAELGEKAVQQDRELGALNDKIAQAESKYFDALARKDATAQEGQLAEINFLEQKKQRTEQAQAADTSLITAKNKQQLLAQELSDIDKRYETLRSTSELENQTATSRLDIQSQLFALETQAGQYSQTYVINTQTALDKEKALLELNIARQQAEDTLAQKRDASEKRIAALRADGADKNTAAIEAETAELSRQQTLTNNTIAGLSLQYTNKVAVLEKSKEINLEQERYNLLIESSNSLAENLTLIFKDLGSSVGGVVSAMVNMAVQSERNNKLLADNAAKQKALNDIDDPLGLSKENQDKLNSLKEEELSLNEKSTKAEIANASKVAGAAKKVFKEKTVAHKAFAALEKGTQLASLAMELKTMAGKISAWWSAIPAKVASETALTAVEGAGAAARAPLTFGQIVGQYLKSIPAPWGMIAGVAAGAYFLKLIGKSGGGGSSGAFVPTAEQRQETQGTAMGWDSQGNKVQVRQGVLGDTDAKSTAITNSLERLAENSVEGLDYDNKMLKALRSIASSIDGAAKGLYRIPGIVSGSISGTTPGTSGSGGFLGIGKKSTTTEILDSGVQFFGTMFDLFRSQNADINLFESVRTTRSKSGFLGIGGGTSSSTDMFFQDLEQTNKRAYDQLIKALGGAGDLVYAMADFAGIAEDEVTTALKSLNVDELVSLRGLKGEEFTNELRALMGTLISDASYSIISQYEDFANFGEDLGEAILRVQDSNKKVRQQLKNMMSADIEDTLNLQGVVPEIRTKIVSSISDTITWASGPQGHADWSTIANMGGKIAQGLYRAYTDATAMSLEDGTQFTNESFTTLLQENFSKLPTADLEKLRSAGFDWANEVVEVIEDGVTRKFDQASIKFESARITEDLIKLAGGEEAFFEQSTFFMENFMTEAERLVPTQKAVTTELARLADLGFTSADGLVDTRQELAQLVQGLDKTDPAARKAYQALMDLAPGFDKVAKAAENFDDKFGDSRQKIAENTAEVTAVFGQLGLQLPATRDEVFELVNALTSTDPQAAAKIRSATDALDDFYSRMESFAQKAKSMQMRILELTGTPEQLLAAQRANTLGETDPGLRATQQYIFALEDVQAAENALTKARQDEANSIKEQQKATEGFVNNLKRYIDSLRKFKDSLLLNAASPLTPAQKYAESKRQFDAILATATGTAATPEEQSAKDAALGQLEGSASAFLEASKVYNASSAQYTTDFNLVQEALTKSINTLTQQLTYEERSLAALNSQVTALQTVNTSVLSVAEAVNRLAIAQGAAAALKDSATQEVNAAASGQSVSTEDLISAAKSSGVGFAYGGTVYGAQGLTTTVAASREAISDYVSKAQSGVEGYTARNMYNIFQDWGLNSKTIAEYMGITQDQVLGWFRDMDSSIPAFAQGTNFVPEDMLAQIHKGERIIPAADNAQLMQNLNSRDEANRVLVAEIRNLRSEVKQLREQQAAETGSIIVANFDAQQRAAEQIEAAMTNTAQQSNWTAKVREGVKLK